MHSLFDACLMGQTAGSVTTGTKFVVVGGASTNKCNVANGSGVVWSEETLPSSGNWIAVSGIPGHFAAICQGTTSAAYSTGNGTWSAATLPASRTWQDVCIAPSGKGVAVASGTDKGAYTTDFGATWAEMTLPSSGTWGRVGFNSNVFCALKDTTDAATSADGISWTARTLSTAAGGVGGDIISSGARFIIVSGTLGMTSDNDGASWTSRAMNGSIGNYYGLAQLGGIICASQGTGLSISGSSDDGVTWATLDTSALGSLPRMAASENTFCTVNMTGTHATVYTSTDGTSWTSQTLATSLAWKDIAWGG